MKAEVAKAIQELKAALPNSTITATDAGDGGGAHVSIEPVDPGPTYKQRETWIRFTIGFQYPYSDVYPLFARPDLARTDDAPLGEGFAVASFLEEPALQISRRSNKLNPATDTAALKVTKVIEWLRTR